MSAPRRLLLAADARFPYWLAGAAPGPGVPLLVAVHGISRNAEEHARAFHAAAARAGLAVLAPLFSAELFPDYQRLGRRGLRADLLLEAILAELRARFGLEVERFHLFGFSGGAQFAHRYALAQAARVRSLQLAAAGWYSRLDPGRRFPHGTAPCRALADLRFDPVSFLHLPIAVFVGARDVEVDERLRRGARLEREQGRNRRERARRWVLHLRAQAERLGLRPRIRFAELPGCGHDFTACVREGGLVTRVLGALAAAPVRV